MSPTTGVSVSPEQNTHLFSFGTELESVVGYCPTLQYLCVEGMRGEGQGVGENAKYYSSVHTVRRRKEV